MTIRPVSDTFYTPQYNTAPRKTQNASDKQIFLANVTRQQQLRAPSQAQVSATPAADERRTDVVDRRRATGKRPAPRPPHDDTVISINETRDDRAQDPKQARSMRDNKVALDYLDKLKAGVQTGKNPLTGNDRKVTQGAYDDFLSERGMADTPDSYRVFVELLSERKTWLLRSGQPNLGVIGEKRFYGAAALERLRERDTGQGPIELAEHDRWMISALSDPTVELTPADRALLARTQWNDNGFRRNLGEWAAKQAAASEPQPGIGQPFSTWLNAADVFADDLQHNPYRMAAKHAGYTDAEIDLALEYYKSHGINSLFVDRSQAGQPSITHRDQVQSVNFGGQDFVLYSMSKEGAELLRDARYAKQHGFDSVDAYRDDFNNTWSDMVGRAGGMVLALEQARDKALGFDQAPFLGPIARGKYDAISKLTLAGSNVAQFFETFGHFFERIADSEERMRYYRNASARAEQNIAEMGRTYPQEEKHPGDQFLRDVTASLPKLMSGPFAPYYTAALHANHPLDTTAAEMIVDGLSLPLGVAAGRLGTGVSGLASKRLEKVVEDKFVQETVEELLTRGTAGTANATASVAMTAALKPARSDAEWANMTDAQKAEERQAYVRNGTFAFMLALLMPGAHRKQDFATLSKPGAQLEGPLVRTGERYYGMVKVTEGSKTSVEMIEVNPSSPKARQLIAAGRVQNAQEGDVKLALALVKTRYGRLPAEARAEFGNLVKQHASEQTLAEAGKAAEKAAAGRGSVDHNATAMIDDATRPNGSGTLSGDADALMEYRVGDGASDVCADPTAVRQANRFKDGGEISERLVDGFQMLGGRQRIGADGKWSDPYRPSVVVDRKQDTVLSQTIDEAHARFDRFKNDPERLAQELAIFSKKKMEPKGWTGDKVDESYLKFRKQNAGKRILLGDFIWRAANGSGAGVCQHQALLFKTLADDFGLDATLVDGVYSRRGLTRLPANASRNHTWNKVHFNGKERVIDPRNIDPRNQNVFVPENKLANYIGLSVREGNTRELKYAQAGKKPGDVVTYEGSPGWRVSDETSVEPGNIVLRHKGFRNISNADFVKWNPGRKLEEGGQYQIIRSNGERELGWIYEGKSSDGTLRFMRQDAVRREVHPRELQSPTVKRPAEAKAPKEGAPVRPLQDAEMVPFERGKVPAGSQVQYRGQEFTLVQYDTLSGKPILFQKGRGKYWAKPYDNMTERQLIDKYDQIVVNGKTMWIDKNRTHISSAERMGDGTFLVGADRQYVLWDEAREPGTLEMWGIKSSKRPSAHDPAAPKASTLPPEGTSGLPTPPPPPDAPPPSRPAGFTTARGSSYEFHDDGTTTRTKAPRPEHPGDLGVKERSVRTVYVDPADAPRFNPPDSATWRIVDHGDGTLSVAVQNADGTWGISPSQRKIPYETAPAVGLSPVEFWRPTQVGGLTAYGGAHPGNPITEVRFAVRPTEAAAPAPPRPPQIAPSKDAAAVPDPEYAKALQARIDAGVAAYKAGDYQEVVRLLSDRKYADEIGLTRRVLTKEELESESGKRDVIIVAANPSDLSELWSVVDNLDFPPMSMEAARIMLKGWMRHLRMVKGGPISELTSRYLAEQGLEWNQNHHEVDTILAFCERGIPYPRETVQAKAVQDWYKSQ